MGSRLHLWGDCLSIRTNKLPYLVIVMIILKILFFFFFFVFSRATPSAYGGSQARGLIGAVVAKPAPEPQLRRIRAASATHTTAHGNAGSLTH